MKGIIRLIGFFNGFLMDVPERQDDDIFWLDWKRDDVPPVPSGTEEYLEVMRGYPHAMTCKLNQA